MSNSLNFSYRFFARWADISYHYAIWIILFILVTVTLGSLYVVNNLGVHTDTTDMLSEDVPFRANHIRYRQSFPQYEDTLLLVLDAPTPEQAHLAAKRFTRYLQNDVTQFPNTYYLTGEPFFEQNGLFYKDLNELSRITDYLAAAQPLVARLAENPTLVTFSSVLRDAVEELRKGRQLELEPVFNGVSATLDARLVDKSRALSWQALLGGEAQKDTYQELIIVQPKLDYSQIFAAERPIEAIRASAQGMGFTPDAIEKLRITGEVALAHDELNSAMHGAQDAGLLALVLVVVVLLIAFRSAGAIFTIIVSLLLGLLLTAAFATVAVGHLNLISIAFAVLYIGLGVDFAVHFLLRLEEIRKPEQTVSEAVYKTGGDMGPSLLICALTTAIGFYAFMPTTYRGVAELGLISGTGMLISFLITVTMIPALQRFFPIRIKIISLSQPINKILDLPRRSRKLVYSVTIIAILASILALPHIKFDYNLLNLNNPHAESVQTFQELLEDAEDSPWHINILVNDSREIEQMARQLKDLPEVKRVISILDLVPEEQEEKSLLIEEMAMILGPISFSPTAFLISNQYTVAEQRMALDQLRTTLSQFIAEQPEHANAASARALQASLTDLLAKLDKPLLENGETREQLLLEVNNDLLSLLPGAIKRLQLALAAQPFAQSALPTSVTELWQGNDGVYRIAVYPSENINDNDALRRFVRAVQQITPNATGVPVISLEAGEAVVDAFIHAFSLALIGVILTIWIMLRSATSTLLVLIPLLLAALFTGASAVVLGLPFNFANIIALPLLLGIGIDSSLHMVYRSRNTGAGYENLLHTSTARAIFYSALTTLAGFGSLIFSIHQGTSSMGQLLTIGLLLTLVCVLVILPILLESESDKKEIAA
ncbi:MMPL family transporter [Nitrosomonas supralitoralis]|uniref:Hopanoid biosynthesis-associated RND transporter HpnN n=1 Tax=Nitrosomonas supralitoralis TaxID=2116706 RepID=A0A2P7NYP6_9PROT|nr:MMPL family transporter [Nitrosomonas supralitoralis]PSJ18572.1 hopanoid biosynthesis-associated RND transporter HpnN [Nitrosomonas supralitoralis]